MNKESSLRACAGSLPDIDRRDNMRKKWISIICAILIMVCTITAPVYAAGIFLPEESNTKQAESTDLIEAPSGILMEAQTGTVVYQKDADTRRSPASITKIMTLILIFDALDKGSLLLCPLYAHLILPPCQMLSIIPHQRSFSVCGIHILTACGQIRIPSYTDNKYTHSFFRAHREKPLHLPPE